MKTDNYYGLNNQQDYNKLLFKKQKDWKKYIIIIAFLILIIFGIIIIYNLNKEYIVTFDLNGSDIIEEEQIKCKANIRGECLITLPVAKKYNGEVLGYSTNPLDYEAKYKVGDKISILDSMKLFVISRVTHTLNIDRSEIDDLSVSEDKLSCYTYNNDNSVCDITVPQFNKRGYGNYGYTDDKNNKNKRIIPGSLYKAEGTLYPVYNTISEIYSINIKDSFALDKTYVDIEESCSNEYVKKYTNYLKDIEEKLPFLFNYQKIIFNGDVEYFKKIIFGGEYSFAVTKYCGISSNCDSFTDNSQPTIIRCSLDDLFDEYLSIIHELFHSADSRYKYHFGKYISDEDDITNLYEKYIDDALDKYSLPTYNINDKPLRFYAYGSKKEFFAELMTFYYINHIDKNLKIDDIEFKKETSKFGSIIIEGYFRGNFPDDMKKVAEKYYCILKNNYDKSKCIIGG